MASLIHNPTLSLQSPIPSKTHISTTSFKNTTLFYTQKQRKQHLTFKSRGFSVHAVTQIDHTQFQDTVLKSEVPVLVEFIADWCGPCRLIAPAIEWAEQEYKDRLKIVKIDHDANPELIEEYKVYGLPGLIVFYDGKAVGNSRREGAMTKVKLKEYIDAILESISVA